MCSDSAIDLCRCGKGPVAVKRSKVMKLYQLFGRDHHDLNLDSEIFMFVQMSSERLHS